MASGARFEARERGLLDGLEFSFPQPEPEPDPALLDALTYADMTTSPRGLPVSFDERFEQRRRTRQSRWEANEPEFVIARVRDPSVRDPSVRVGCTYSNGRSERSDGYANPLV